MNNNKNNNNNKRAGEDVMSSLHSELARLFMEKLRTKSATPQELQAIRQFLKDNDITCIGEYSDEMQEIVASLPVFSAEENALV